MANVLSSIKQPQSITLGTTTPTRTAASTSPISNALNAKKEGGGLWSSIKNQFSAFGNPQRVLPPVNYATPYLQSKRDDPSSELSKTMSGTTPYSPTKPATVESTTSPTQTSPVVETTKSADKATQVSSTPSTPLSQTTQGLINIGQKQSPAAVDAETLRKFAAQPSPEVLKTQEEYNKFMQSSPYMQAAQFNPNVAADIASGRSSLLGQVFGQLASAKQAAVSNALTGQGQQIGAADQAGQLGLTGQGQQISALGTAGGLSSPIAGPGGVLGTPQSVQPFQQGANTTFGGGVAGAQVGLGGKFTENQATMNAVTGMTQDFSSALKSSGLNTGPAPVLNSVKQMLSTNLSGPALQLQTQFNNIIAQYSKILGAQTVNSLLASSQDTTIEQFLNTLNKQAQQVQSGIQSAGTGGAGQTAQQTSGTMFGSFF